MYLPPGYEFMSNHYFITMIKMFTELCTMRQVGLRLWRWKRRPAEFSLHSDCKGEPIATKNRERTLAPPLSVSTGL